MPQHNLTITDKILAKTLLHLIPHWMTPNLISWLRFASVPFIGYFLWNESYVVALPLFFISAFSDAVDGSLARTRNLVTDFGKMFDPLADKLLISAAAIIVIPRYLDWSIVLAIVTIELTLVASAYVQKTYYGKTIQAENTGKLKMILQSLGIGALLVYTIWNIALVLMLAQYFFYAAIFFALLSLVVYRAI
ncbi:MAG: CDP-alcohol phosphatidyltransferase family protein [Candidatus Yonathbacteria bacterium]|nr:CDP-alcohol phosphatidyltransferase family protein [Candidatus Yonathbacteria bacterium]